MEIRLIGYFNNKPLKLTQLVKLKFKNNVYDTTKVIKRYNQEERDDIEAFFLQKLIPSSDTHYLNGYKGRSLRATYKNWNFYLGESNIKIVGSLTSASKGNNLYNASYADIYNAIEELKEFCPFNLDNARVARLDIANSLEMNLPTYSYHNFLICPDKFQESGYKHETLQFEKDGLVYKFYDKIKERKKSRALPKSYSDKNILRYELSMDTKAMRRFNLDNLTLLDLQDKTLFYQIASIWYEQYNELLKKRKYVNYSFDAVNLTAYKNYAVKYFYNTDEGRDFTTALLFDKKQSSKGRSDIKKYLANMDKGVHEKNELEEELRKKILLIIRQSV